jgi:hypothetical protein
MISLYESEVVEVRVGVFADESLVCRCPKTKSEFEQAG